MTGYDNFWCRLCTNSKTKAERQKIILYNIQENKIEISDVCMMCFIKLRGVLSVRQRSEKQTTMLENMGIEK